MTAAATFALPAAAAAPGPGASDRSTPGARASAAHGAPHGDRNSDHVDDAFEHRLAAASRHQAVDVIVTGLPAGQARAAVGAFRTRRTLATITGFSATMTASQARALARHPGVRRVEAVATMRTLDEGSHRDFGVTAAKADRAGLDGSGVGICVVDTGIDPAHEQIAPRTVTFHDFIGTATTSYDDQGHGTHVTSIAAGDGAGGVSASSYVGVAPAAQLFAAKVLDSTGSGPNDGVAAGIEWCAAQPAVDVISISLGEPAGGDGTDAVSLTVNAAVAAGKLVVVAAGNSGDSPETISAPGTATGAITVGAVAEHSNPTGTAWHDDGTWLAAFSSRGPTVDGRIKPDVAAPGVTVQAARANTGTGYVTFSGTSMATPFVSGAVALALDADPTATPAGVRTALLATAEDVGAPGQDNEWGAGLIDVRALVDAVAGASTPRRTPMQAHSRVTGSVPAHGELVVPIQVPADGVGVPLAVTVTLDGEGGCVMILGVCWPLEWSPDLDADLRGPTGALLAVSECALSGLSCGYGRQETLAIVPTTAGTYLLRVYTFEGGPDDGAGGTFSADIFHGPLAGGTPPPPPPANVAPVAAAGPDQKVILPKRAKLATFTLDGSSSTDSDGTIASYRWTSGGVQVATGPTPTLSRKVGTWTFDLTVTDDDGATSTDQVVVKVVTR